PRARDHPDEQGRADRRALGRGGGRRRLPAEAGGRPGPPPRPRRPHRHRVTPLRIILFLAILMAAVSLAAVLAWLAYGAYLTARERRRAARKGLYRDLVTGLATRERTLLEPAFRQLETIRDVEALEAVLEEQARKS